jgi:hypothetical protein
VIASPLHIRPLRQFTLFGHGGLYLIHFTEPSGSNEPNAKSRRRRRGADPESQPKNQSFYFVDSTSSSKEKRAHVMRHHVQEKRKHRKLSHGSLQREQMPEPTVWPVRTDSGYDTDTPKEAALAGVPGSAVEQESSVWRFSLLILVWLYSEQAITGLRKHYADTANSSSSRSGFQM